MDAVAIKDVCKSFGEVRAVNYLNVTVPAGSIYGFLGPNGAGKTTTIRMIMNILRPDSGQIALFGDHSAGRTKSRIGYMPEERGLYRKMTVRKVLTTVDSPAGRLGAWRRMGRRPGLPDRHPDVRQAARPAGSRPMVEAGLRTRT